jgi:hypothetical protein
MKITRVLEGERYTSPAAGGLGFVSATAEEDGYEIDYAGTVMWVTDEALAEAMRQKMREGLVILHGEVSFHGGGEEMELPQIDTEPFKLLVDAKAAAEAIEAIEQFVLPGCEVGAVVAWAETIDALTPAPAGKATVVPLNHEVVEVPSSEEIQSVLDRADELAKVRTEPARPTDGKCEHCRRPIDSCPGSHICTRCHACKMWIADEAPRIFTTAGRVYCLNCGNV